MSALVPDFQYLTIATAAKTLDCSEKSVRRMISRGELKAYRVGKLIRIHPKDLAKAIRPVTTYERRVY